MQDHAIYTAPWWGALTRRWRCLPGGSLTIKMNSMIQPVVDVDRLVDRVRFLTVTLTPVANGRLVAFTVPGGKRWILYSYFSPIGTGDYSKTVVLRPDAVLTGQAQTLEGVSTAGGAIIGTRGPLPMDSGATFQADVTLFVGTGNLILNLWVVEQDIYDTRVPLPAA